MSENVKIQQNMAFQKSLLIILILFTVFLKSNAQFPSKISTKGKDFVDSLGNKVVFNGFNIADPEKLIRDGKWNDAIFKEIKNWGGNIVRIPVHPSNWRKIGKKEYLKILEQAISYATANQLYLIFEWHSIGNLRTEMFQTDYYDTTKKETFDFWRTIANYFKNNPVVAFYELFNEPTLFNGQLGTCTWAEWKVLNEEIIGIIRSHKNNTVILIAGFNWAYDLSEAGNDPILGPNIGYVSHPYPQKRSQPWPEQWTKDWGFMAKKYPVLLTEIGFCGAEEKGAHIPVISDESYGVAITKYCEENGISWLGWVFDNQWAPAMFSDWNYTPTRQGKFFKNYLQQKQLNSKKRP